MSKYSKIYENWKASKVQESNKEIITLTKQQNKELDNLKNKIQYIERNISNAQNKLDLAHSLGNTKDIKSIEKSIEHGNNQIKNMVEIQSISMKLDPTIVLDLIFDREYTLAHLNG